MNAGSLDLNGTWDGMYFYKDDPDAGPATPFVATIRETNGSFTGTVIEPHELIDRTMQATIHGHRQGRTVNFSKDYETVDVIYQATVLYQGTLCEDGQTIAGEWSIDHWKGSFEMTRALSAAAVAERRQSAELEI